MISKWFQIHLDFVFFIYGLAFLLMGALIQLLARKGSVFRIGDIFWFLAGFGLLHGVNEWMDMWVIIKGRNDVIDIIRWCCLVTSYIFLFEFGRRLVKSNISSTHALFKTISAFLGRFMTPAIVFVILIVGFKANDFWTTGSIFARYLLGFTGSLLTAAGFHIYFKFEKSKLAPLGVKKYFYCTIFAFLFYGITGGLIVPEGNFFPANIFNDKKFISYIQIPVQVFRAALAVMAAWGVAGILKVFNWEREKNFESSLKRITQNYQIQDVINKILKVSLEPISFHDQLQRILNLILTIPTLSLHAKGCIYLTDEESGYLKLLVQQNFSEEQFQRCSTIPFGKCLCGLAAERQEIVFTESIENKEHEISYPGIQPHGHYCIPIISHSQVLGVINVYVNQGHKREEKEEDVFASIANTLAGIIMRKKARETIRVNYNIQSIISAILQISLLPITLKEHLEKTLEIISTIPWLSEKSTGCIFLIEDNPDVLVLKTHRRIPCELLKSCGNLPVGKCLCGRAASTGEIVFADSVDDRHDVRYEGMHNHGHYCIPIKSRGRVLGVINLYVKENSKRSELEERVFTSIADTLAGIIERKRTEERLEYMANFDILTGLPNRILFLDRLTQEIKRSKRLNSTLALLYIDLDKFKCVNDTLGHDSGDMLLKSTASRLTDCVRESDTVARMSGDEFTLILPAIHDRHDVESIAKKIIQKLSDPYEIQDTDCSVTPSIGISFYPSDGADTTTLLKNADMAMYNVKKS